MSDLNSFEESLLASIKNFNKERSKDNKKPLTIKKGKKTQEAQPKKTRWKPEPKPTHRITLGVRDKLIAHEKPYIHYSFCISQLEAELEARKAAKDKGLHVSWVIDRERL